jgi:hypothetical protein
MSELCKFVWAGSLALFLAALTSDQSKVVTSFYGNSRWFLLLAAICGSLSMVFEYLQFVSGYKHAVNFVTWIERQVTARTPITCSSYNQNTTTGLSRLNDAFFVAKNISALAAAVLIALAVIRFAFA